MENKEMLQHILRYIDENIREELSVSILAEEAGYSPFHFSRIFTKTAGMPAMSYATAEAAICPLRFVTGKESGGCRSGIWF